MFPEEWLTAAATRIKTHIRRTPLTYDRKQNLYLKWENQQVTGSFKARGALNKVLALEPWERQTGLVAASAGNHGQGVALAGRLVESHVTIFASEHAVWAKVEAMRALGAEVRLVSGGYGEAEADGLDHARQYGATWVSPYNDGQVIAGQATLGLELLEQMPELADSTWVVPVGGGGLAAGLGAALQYAHDQGRFNASFRRPRLVGVQVEASPFMHALYHNGSQTEVIERPTLADGLAGPVEAGSLTIPLVRRWLDDLILVDEEQLQNAITYAWERYNEKIEGSAAVGLAAVLSDKLPQRPALVVISGGNIQPEVHARLAGVHKGTL